MYPSFLREEKKAKEASIIVLCKFHNKQTEVIFHLCFCFAMFERKAGKRDFGYQKLYAEFLIIRTK